MSNLFIGLGALNAFLAVAFGAFAAHSLKATLPPEQLSIIQTAADYQIYHGLGLILIGLLNMQSTTLQHRRVGWIMLAGIILFCGSLYILGITGIKWLGMITPLGGLCFLIAWLMLAYTHIFKTQNKSSQHPPKS